MSGVKHTPGPWHLSPEVHKRIVFAKDGYAVADTTVYHAKHGDDPKAVMEANARLIAAAPDLLEAIQVLVTDCSQIWSEAEFPALKQARAAIARARGEQSPNHSDTGAQP